MLKDVGAIAGTSASRSFFQEAYEVPRHYLLRTQPCYTLANQVLKGFEADRKLNIVLATANASFKTVNTIGQTFLLLGTQT